MSDATNYRQLWKDRGELFDCPNPPHTFSLGSLIGQWRWAASSWSSVNVNGDMSNYGLCLCTINTLDGLRAYKLVIWRLSIIVALASEGGGHV